MKRNMGFFTFLFIVMLLTSCASSPDSSLIDGIEIAKPIQPTNPTQISEDTHPTTFFDPTVLPSADYNDYCIHIANGQTITDSLRINDEYELVIDAVVDVSSVEKIGIYKYIPSKLTDLQRDALLTSYFGNRVDEVKHHTAGWANQWILNTDTEYYEFGYSWGMKLINEETFFLRNFKVLIEEHDERMLNTIEEAGMSISLDEAYSMCNDLLSTVSNGCFLPDNVRPFKLNSLSDHGMLWIVFRQVIDGIPVIADNDIKFYVTDDEVVNMIGSVYTLSPVTFDKKILTLEEAIISLRNSVSRINPEEGFLYLDNIYSEQIPITKITLEYIVLQDSNMDYIVTPVWRFQIGDTKEEQLIMRDRIIAINAITGDLISERRRHTY